MIIKTDENLSQYSLMRIGGIANKFFIPENKKELIELLKSLKQSNEEYWIIGGGSNILINDLKHFENVIYMGEFNNEFCVQTDGTIYVGASVRLQNLIRQVNDLGYGGLEYLFSVPAMLGGAVVMNAGRGKSYNKSISDYIVKVEVFRNGVVEIIEKEDCQFAYRNSVFKQSQDVILGVYFKFFEMSMEESKMLRAERIQYAKNKQDASKPNLGSLLKKGNKIALFLLRKTQFGYKDGIHFSGKCNNWLVNEGNGNFAQAIEVIEKSKKLHRIMLCKQELEVIIWR